MARVRRSWGWFCVGVLAGLAALVPAHYLTSVPSIGRDYWTSGARAAALHSAGWNLGWWWALFAVTACALLRAPRRPAVVVALGLGAAASAVSLVHTAVLSDDLYRYAWDGRVQAAGINPYRYAPDDPRLAGLRDEWLWPSAQECAALGKDIPCTRINRPGVHTIYPPAAQLWFRLAHAVLPRGSRDLGYELLGLVVSLAVGALLAWLLWRTGRDPRWVVLWACCPVVPLEAVQNAHVDVVAALLVAVACAVLLLAPRWSACGGRGRQVGAAVLVAGAGLVKLYPFVLLPALVQRRRPSAWTAAVIVAALAYLPFVVSVGGGVAGYLSGYLQEQGYDNGDRFLLLSLTGLTGTPVRVVAWVIIGAVGMLAVLRRLGPPLPAALTVFVTLLLVATPGEPWYELVLVVLVVLTGCWQWLGLIVAEYVVYLTALLGGPHVPASQGAYLVALVLGVGVTVLRRRGRRLEGDPVAGSAAADRVPPA